MNIYEPTPIPKRKSYAHLNEPAKSEQYEFLSVPLSVWSRKITAILSLSTIVIMSGVLFAAAVGAFLLLFLFLLEQALV